MEQEASKSDCAQQKQEAKNNTATKISNSGKKSQIIVLRDNSGNGLIHSSNSQVSTRKY